MYSNCLVLKIIAVGCDSSHRAQATAFWPNTGLFASWWRFIYWNFFFLPTISCNCANNLFFFLSFKNNHVFLHSFDDFLAIFTSTISLQFDVAWWRHKFEFHTKFLQNIVFEVLKVFNSIVSSVKINEFHFQYNKIFKNTWDTNVINFLFMYSLRLWSWSHISHLE